MVLACFENAKQKSHSCDRTVVVGSAKTHSDGAPREHEERDPSAWLHALEEVVRGHLEERVGNQKHHESNCVVQVGHAGFGEKVMLG